MKEKALTIPNILSISRFFLAGLLFYYIMTHQIYFSFAVYFIAMLTDYFDGKLARKAGQHTKLGYYLDAYADNTLIATIFLGIFIAGTISFYEFIGYLLIVSLTTTGFFLSPSKDIFYKAFEKARMKKVGGIFIILFIVSSLLELPFTSPYITGISFSVLLITSSVFLYNVVCSRKKQYAKEA